MEPVTTENYITNAFKQYSNELTAKHDKYERIVKIGRDITIESKRLIFTIHSFPKGPKANDDPQAIEKIKERFKKLVDSHFKKIALELENEDPYLYHRAYTWGVQEYVEALTYFYYVTELKLIGWKEIVDNFTYSVDEAKEGDAISETRSVKLVVPLADYILGIQDMTGEMMRLCINTLGKGDAQTAQTACSFVQHIYAALHALPSSHNEFYKKLEVAGQSLRKMEYGCYLAKMQSTEMKSRGITKVNFPSFPLEGS